MTVEEAAREVGQHQALNVHIHSNCYSVSVGLGARVDERVGSYP